MNMRIIKNPIKQFQKNLTIYLNCSLGIRFCEDAFLQTMSRVFYSKLKQNVLCRFRVKHP